MRPAGEFGSGQFEFGEWTTPFTDAEVEILEVAYVVREQGGSELLVRIRDLYADTIYRLVFSTISAVRLLDEGELLEFWEKTAELGGRPGRTTFRVRNHAWTRESMISFLASDGTSFVIASNNECVEVVSVTAPTIVAG
ncbi:hypothetical protein D8780_05515 [Notoacmeibacter ruber]|uniref:Uncharacterized protein n=1 Tax=Notoacmeibacter ruber TaxID=2670375 RepID=A0A3L7JBI1_9HYPH|nr:hypothetical protein D8780_05515 [Notoacmeibacter ruber]